MPEQMVSIDVDSKKLQEGLTKAPEEMRRNWSQAGREVAKKILQVVGLRAYPAEPSTGAGKRGYGYLRGVGYQRKDGTNDGRSERYGSQWNVSTPSGSVKTVIGNRASYAPHLGGEKQSTVVNKNISGQGWRRLVDVADDQTDSIGVIYTKWMRRALQRVGLL